MTTNEEPTQLLDALESERAIRSAGGTSWATDVGSQQTGRQNTTD